MKTIILLFISILLLVYCVVYIILEKIFSEKLIINQRLLLIEETDYKQKNQDSDQRRKRFKISFVHVPKKLRAELILAGIPLQPEEYVLICVCMIGFPGIMAFMFSGNIIISLVLIVLGTLIPPALIKIHRKKRTKKFNEQLGNSLLVISSSLRAGFTFEQALSSVARDMPSPISDEFSKAVRELRYGSPLDKTLFSLAERMQSKDLDLLNSAVLIQKQVGGNLADIVETISETIQDRIKIKNSIRVLTAQGRISGLIVGLLPFGLLGILILINPTYIMPLFTTSLGRIMMAVAIVMELVGFFVINKIINIKY